MSVSLRVLALLSIFLVDYDRIRDANEQEDKNIELVEEYDFVVVGAGNTGSVVATRLAENGQQVLLVEAGESGRHDSDIDIPYQSIRLPGSHRDWDWKIAKQSKLNIDRELRYQGGKMGGGTSAMNHMVYARGSEHDYMLWEDKGATGWGLENLKKYFEKVEQATQVGMSESLGRSGKIKLSMKYDYPLRKIIETAANQIGISSVDYLDGGGLKIGASNVTAAVYKGKRQYAVNSYLYPEMSKENSTLTVAFGARAHKILFRNGNDKMEAYALKFNHSGIIKTVKFRKEIIVSAGAINSPHVLMLSGIGPRKHLIDIGIDVIADVPGVGSNADGHTTVLVDYYGDKLPSKFSFTPDQVLETFPDYEKDGSGPMGTVELIANMINLRSKYAGTKNVLGSEKYPFPDINIHSFGLGRTIESFRGPNNEYKATFEEAKANRNGTLSNLRLSAFLCHTLSKGTVRLESKDPNELPIYDPNYYGNRRDFKVMKEALRTVERLERSREFQKYGLKFTMIPDVCLPLYTEPPRTSAFYKCYIEKVTTAFQHASSTCKMGFRSDKMAVLDSRLRVHAVKNVRVADASVFPHVTSANPHATCYVVGEKAADMIKEDWKM